VGHTHHNRDKVIRKDGAPAGLWGNEDWAQVLEETEILAGMKYFFFGRQGQVQK
jgi:hypothetical protein